MLLRSGYLNGCGSRDRRGLGRAPLLLAEHQVRATHRLECGTRRHRLREFEDVGFRRRGVLARDENRITGCSASAPNFGAAAG